MQTDSLLKKAKQKGSQSIDEFVKSNLHYLSRQEQQIFYDICTIKYKSNKDKYGKN